MILRVLKVRSLTTVSRGLSQGINRSAFLSENSRAGPVFLVHSSCGPSAEGHFLLLEATHIAWLMTSILYLQRQQSWVRSFSCHSSLTFLSSLCLSLTTDGNGSLLLGIHVILLGSPGHPRSFSHLKVLHLITSAKTLLLSKVTSSFISSMDMFEGLFFCLP